jgi:hypothetical protein
MIFGGDAMTIRELLEADWTIAEIDVTVRDIKGIYTMGYVIGKDITSHASIRCGWGFREKTR